MRSAVVAICFAMLASCVKAPNVSVVDNKTALERQAAGEYHALENDLEQAGISPRGEPIPREELVPNREAGSSAALGELAQLYAKVESDADRIDRLLVARCIGEARSGVLEPRPTDCKAKIETAEMTRILGRANLHRRQMWQLIHAERPGADIEAIRVQWRAIHLERVICGGLIEGAPGTWEPKSC